jgi:hypothetical protein
MAVHIVIKPLEKAIIYEVLATTAIYPPLVVATAIIQNIPDKTPKIVTVIPSATNIVFPFPVIGTSFSSYHHIVSQVLTLWEVISK